jgi:hypothetical protein
VDDSSKIETYKAYLRLKFAGDTVGLKALVTALGDGDATNAVVITAHNFESGGSSGQLVLEPMARLEAALAVLREFDPTLAPEAPNYAYARWSTGTMGGVR